MLGLGRMKQALKQARTNRLFAQEKPKDTPLHFPLVMSKHEKAYLENAFKLQGGGAYLEFGSGGSTFLGLLHSHMNITSVESDPAWLLHLQEWKLISQALSSGRLKFECVDIGRVGAWGVPQEMDKKESFPLYSQEIFKKKQDFDMVFIDGRFRVACTLSSIMYCNPKTKIFIHDFNNRPHYHKVVEFLDFVDTCDTLAEFRIKKDINTQILQQTYEEYKYNYD